MAGVRMGLPKRNLECCVAVVTCEEGADHMVKPGIILTLGPRRYRTSSFRSQSFRSFSRASSSFCPPYKYSSPRADVMKEFAPGEGWRQQQAGRRLCAHSRTICEREGRCRHTEAS
jgi:hypothetical protein